MNNGLMCNRTVALGGRAGVDGIGLADGGFRDATIRIQDLFSHAAGMIE
jgi:hypothetical protein